MNFTCAFKHITIILKNNPTIIIDWYNDLCSFLLCLFCIQAEEVTSVINYGNTTATTLVTISVSDVNDNTPTFNHNNYTATIQENMQNGVPVIFTANTIMSVNDIDQVSQGHHSCCIRDNFILMNVLGKYSFTNWNMIHTFLKVIFRRKECFINQYMYQAASVHIIRCNNNKCDTSESDFFKV